MGQSAEELGLQSLTEATREMSDCFDRAFIDNRDAHDIEVNAEGDDECTSCGWAGVLLIPLPPICQSKAEKLLCAAVGWYERAALDEGWEGVPEWVTQTYQYFITQDNPES